MRVLLVRIDRLHRCQKAGLEFRIDANERTGTGFTRYGKGRMYGMARVSVTWRKSVLDLVEPVTASLIPANGNSACKILFDGISGMHRRWRGRMITSLLAR